MYIQKTEPRRAILIGFAASGFFLTLVALPTFFLDAIGKVQFLPKLWSLLWEIYFSPATLLGDGEMLKIPLMISSPDPRIGLIPALGLNFIFWGALMSVFSLFVFRLRNET